MLIKGVFYYSFKYTTLRFIMFADQKYLVATMEPIIQLKEDII